MPVRIQLKKKYPSSDLNAKQSRVIKYLYEHKNEKPKPVREIVSELNKIKGKQEIKPANVYGALKRLNEYNNRLTRKNLKKINFLKTKSGKKGRKRKRKKPFRL